MSFKSKRLYEKIKKLKKVYEEDLTVSEKAMAKNLFREGLLVKGFGSWSGKVYYIPDNKK